LYYPGPGVDIYFYCLNRGNVELKLATFAFLNKFLTISCSKEDRGLYEPGSGELFFYLSGTNFGDFDKNT